MGNISPAGIEPGWFIQQTQTTDNTNLQGSINWPNQTITVPNTGGYGTVTTPGLYSSPPVDMRSVYEKCVQPVGENFILISAPIFIQSNGKQTPLWESLSKTKNLRYLFIDQEIMVPKYVWELILMYILNKDENKYASLDLHEFLDKINSPV